MSLKTYIFSSINTKGGPDSDKFATIRFTSLRSMETKNGDGNAAVEKPTQTVTNDVAPVNTTTSSGKINESLHTHTQNVLFMRF